MDKLEIRKECKKFIRNICDCTPKIVFRDSWHYNFIKDELAMIFEEEEREQEEVILNFFQKLTDTNYSLAIYSFLHEVGHFIHFLVKPEDFDDDEIFLQENHRMNQILSITKQEKILPFNEILELYYEDFLESKANEYLLFLIKYHQKEIKKLEKVFSS